MARKIIIVSLVAILLLAGLALPTGLQVKADDGNPWSQVFLPNGDVNWSNLTDRGQVTENVSWMPTIPGLGPIPATYHIYTTPDGNTVVLPSPTTILFGSIATAQGIPTPFGNASSQFGTGFGLMTEVLGLVTGGGAITLTNGMTYVDPAAFAQAVIDGKENIFSLPLLTTLRMFELLFSPTASDSTLYLLALMFTPEMCAQVPGGCPPDLLALVTAIPAIPTPAAKSPPPKCPAPSVKQGRISAGGQKTAPEYPLVVGQDPKRTGVDLSFNASVAPTLYTYYTTEAVFECKSGPDAQGRYNCKNGTGHLEQEGWTCQKHAQSFNECITSATARVSLSKDSRDWITKVLSLRYPGAYVHQPEFSFAGKLACSWSASQKGVQIQDPGNWLITVSGTTSGTPVTAPRNFSLGGSPFDVYLKESAITD